MGHSGRLVREQQRILPVVLVVTTLLSAGYYLPVVMAAYMRDPLRADAHEGAGLPRPAVVTVALALVIVVLLGLLPSGVLGWSLETAGSVLQVVGGR
jgi:NADH:ubiquinone oxidoreductase subunit 2 (subunit N)